MIRYFFFLLTLIVLASSCKEQNQNTRPDFVLVIHGGAGTILKEDMTPEKEQRYLKKLEEALTVGSKILRKGGTSLDAVTKTIMVMEDSPFFRSGWSLSRNCRWPSMISGGVSSRLKLSASILSPSERGRPNPRTAASLSV